MQIPDINTIVPAINGTTLSGILLYILWRDVIKPRYNGKLRPGASAQVQVCACSEIIGLSAKFGDLVKAIDLANKEAREDRKSMWTMIHDADARLRVLESGRERGR